MMAMDFGRNRCSTVRNTTTLTLDVSRHGRACAGHPRLSSSRAAQSWMPAFARMPVAALSPDALQPLRRVERRVDDALIAGAPAEIARNRDPHLLLGGVRIVAQELDQRRQHAGGAEAALQAVIVAERLLQRVQLLV